MGQVGLHDEHRKRVKNRFINQGMDGWEPHQILEMLLFYAIPQKDTNELAHRLIERFGSFHAVLEAGYEELVEVNGIGAHAATLITMILPMLRQYNKDRSKNGVIVNSSETVGNYLLGFYLGVKVEKVYLMSLDTKGNVLAVDLVCEGDITSASFSMRKVIEIVLRRSAAYAVIAHNHPSHVALPSDDDIWMTMAAADALKNIGVRLIDHIIFGADDFVSLADSAQYKTLFK